MTAEAAPGPDGAAVTVSASDVPATLAIIAGQGDFAGLIARAARANGVRVVALGIKGFAPDSLAADVDAMHWAELGQVGRMVELLHAEGCRHVTLAGRVPHLNVLQYRHFDLRALKVLGRAVTRKADALLGAVSAELDAEGIRVVDSSMFLKSLMPEAGLLTPGRSPTPEEAADIKFGLPLAKGVAGMDIGQTIVVKGLMVIAVEGVEGTDACIRRAGELAGPGCVVVKVSKPRQDMRFDIPVVGPGTLGSMKAAGVSALAVTARETLLFHRETVLRDAEAAGIAVVAI